jgi:hypothetical protein
MGIARAKIRLDNPKRTDLQPLEVNALADTGALYLCIPEEVRIHPWPPCPLRRFR